MDKELFDNMKINEGNFNSLQVPINAINSDKKTIDVILSDETKVVRFNFMDGVYDLVLEHSNEAIDFTRKDIMPLLVQHNREMLPIGIWEDVRLEDGKVKGRAKFDIEDEFAMQVFGKYEREIMKSFSVGISILEKIQTKEVNENGRKEYKATKWGLDEASAVTIPAIPNAKVGFNKENQNSGVNPATAQITNQNSQKETTMTTVEEFKSQHPDLYKQVFSAGAEDLKDKVMAHCEMAKQTGAFEFALEQIEKGEGLTQTATAKYLTFGLNKQDQEQRQEENFEDIKPSATDENAEKDAKDEELAKAVADKINVNFSKVTGA